MDSFSSSVYFFLLVSRGELQRVIRIDNSTRYT